MGPKVFSLFPLFLQFFNVPCPNIYQLCDVVNVEINDMEAQYAQLKESSIHFQLQPPDELKLTTCRRLAKIVKNMWDFMLGVSSCIDNWKMTSWKKIDVEDMESECKRFSKEMRGMEKDVKALKPYTETEAMIKNLLTSLKAIIELQNPAIRERHWVELMQATKVCWSRFLLLSMSFSFIFIFRYLESLEIMSFHSEVLPVWHKV